MKKIKLLPSILLLVLCLGILGVGIYAAKPASNTISGTVSVTAANAEVEISVYQDNYDSANPATNRQSTATTRAGATLAFGDFTFDASGADTKYDVPMKEIIIVVKNHSTNSDLGMYFWNTNNGTYSDSVYIHATTKSETGFVAGTVPDQADILNVSSTEYSDILYGHHKYDSVADLEHGYVANTNVIDVEYEFYKHIPKAVDTNSDGNINETDYVANAEVIRMYIRLDKMVEDPAKINLEVKLNIEKYQSTTLSLSDGPMEEIKHVGNSGFVKVPVGCEETLGGFSSCSHVVLSNGTIVNDSGIGTVFSGNNMKVFSIPKSFTSLGDKFVWGCDSLTSVFLPEGITTMQGGFACIRSASLTTLVLPKSLLTMNSSYVIYCPNIKFIKIPSSVTGFGGGMSEQFDGSDFEVVVIDSSYVAGLSSSDSELLADATTVYVLSGLTVGTYITGSFHTVTSNMSGYVKYVKNS